jgi:small-conductance mechanosensitive channel/CRP-like cAMP-binding protein
MHDPLGLISGNDRALEVTGLILGVLLLFGARALLPPDEKKKAGQPALFLLLSIFFGVSSALVNEAAKVERPLMFLYAFFLIASPARSLVLILLDVVLARRTHKPTPRIFRDVVQSLVYVAIAMLTLRAVGVELGSILTTSAVLTAVVGLALQDTLGNMVSGLALQMQRPFDVGDWVQYVGDGQPTIGRVTEVNWRATTLMTHDMVEVIVPNGVLAKSSVRNYSKPSPVSRRNVIITVGYDVSPERVHRVVLEAITGAPGLLADPAPWVLTKNFADSWIEYTVFYFIDDMQKFLPIEGRVRDRIYYAFQRAGIEFPSPARTVHLHEVSEESRRRERERALEKRDRALKCVDFLDVLAPEDHKTLAAAVYLRRYAADEVIVREGEKSSELFIIDSGEVVVEVSRQRDGQRTGTQLPVARLGAGKFFGEMSLMTGEERKATVRAATECTLLVVDHDAFHDTLAAHPEIIERMSEILAQRQAELEETVQSSRDRKSMLPMSDRSNRLISQIRGFFNL